MAALQSDPLDWEDIGAHLDGVDDAYKDPRFDALKHVLTVLSNDGAATELERLRQQRRLVDSLVGRVVAARYGAFAAAIRDHSRITSLFEACKRDAAEARAGLEKAESSLRPGPRNLSTKAERAARAGALRDLLTQVSTAAAAPTDARRALAVGDLAACTRELRRGAAALADEDLLAVGALREARAGLGDALREALRRTIDELEAKVFAPGADVEFGSAAVPAPARARGPSPPGGEGPGAGVVSPDARGAPRDSGHLLGGKTAPPPPDPARLPAACLADLGASGFGARALVASTRWRASEAVADALEAPPTASAAAALGVAARERSGGELAGWAGVRGGGGGGGFGPPGVGAAGATGEADAFAADLFSSVDPFGADAPTRADDAGPTNPADPWAAAPLLLPGTLRSSTSAAERELAEASVRALGESLEAGERVFRRAARGLLLLASLERPAPSAGLDLLVAERRLTERREAEEGRGLGISAALAAPGDGLPPALAHLDGRPHAYERDRALSDLADVWVDVQRAVIAALGRFLRAGAPGSGQRRRGAGADDAGDGAPGRDGARGGALRFSFADELEDEPGAEGATGSGAAGGPGGAAGARAALPSPRARGRAGFAGPAAALARRRPASLLASRPGPARCDAVVAAAAGRVRRAVPGDPLLTPHVYGTVVSFFLRQQGFLDGLKRAEGAGADGEAGGRDPVDGGPAPGAGGGSPPPPPLLLSELDELARSDFLPSAYEETRAQVGSALEARDAWAPSGPAGDRSLRLGTGGDGDGGGLTNVDGGRGGGAVGGRSEDGLPRPSSASPESPGPGGRAEPGARGEPGRPVRRRAREAAARDPAHAYRESSLPRAAAAALEASERALAWVTALPALAPELVGMAESTLARVLHAGELACVDAGRDSLAASLALQLSRRMSQEGDAALLGDHTAFLAPREGRAAWQAGGATGGPGAPGPAARRPAPAGGAPGSAAPSAPSFNSAAEAMLSGLLASEFSSGGEAASADVERKVFDRALSGGRRLPARGDPSPAACLAALSEGLSVVSESLAARARAAASALADREPAGGGEDLFRNLRDLSARFRAAAGIALRTLRLAALAEVGYRLAGLPAELLRDPAPASCLRQAEGALAELERTLGRWRAEAGPRLSRREAAYCFGCVPGALARLVFAAVADAEASGDLIRPRGALAVASLLQSTQSCSTCSGEFASQLLAPGAPDAEWAADAEADDEAGATDALGLGADALRGAPERAAGRLGGGGEGDPARAPAFAPVPATPRTPSTPSGGYFSSRGGPRAGAAGEDGRALARPLPPSPLDRARLYVTLLTYSPEGLLATASAEPSTFTPRAWAALAGARVAGRPEVDPSARAALLALVRRDDDGAL